MSVDGPPDPFRRPVGARRGRALLPTLVVLALLAVAFAVLTSFWTDRLWFDSVGRVDVFTTSLATRAGLFVVFGLLMAASVVGNAVLAHRMRPRYRPMSAEQQSLDRYREALDPVRRWVVITLAVLAGLIAGGSASAEWETFLQWRNGQDFGTTDPQFGQDVSFYVFAYPFYRFLLGFLFAAVVVGFLVALVTHYLYGGLRLQTVGDKVTKAAQAHLSVLIGLFVLLKAIAYWLDRYGLLTSDHSLVDGFTGATYTDVNANLWANTSLAVISLVCAVLFFVNVVRRSFTLPVIGLGLLVLSAILLGGIYPAIVQQFQVRPSEPIREAPYIERNIAATRDAYQLSRVQVQNYAAATETTGANQLRGAEDSVPGIRLLDPNVVSPTFQQLQQVRPFYRFADPLDVDRYDISGRERDVVVGVRDINVAGIPEGQRSWVNEHTVYTHGYGFFAAFGNQRDANGNPVFVEDGEAATNGPLGQYEPRIYFGENSPEYSIVGAPEGSAPVEYDVPDGASNNTYSGDGGVPVGNLFTKLLYAAKFQEGNILLSERVNAESQILYERGPRERVEKVAPWLTVDGDPLPAVVNGRILWIIDAYTTLDDYPYSQRVSLEDATTDTRAVRQNVAGLPPRTVNYMRNSVKATVDAYTGQVVLYAWDESDPVLRTWQAVFPDALQPRSEIPAELLQHMRYPQDVFKVQRQLLQKYHITDPSVFYTRAEVWVVPDDPAPGTGTAGGDIDQPPYYLTLRMPGTQAAAFSLTTSFTRRDPPNLAAFMAVDADAANPDDYGTIRVLQLPSERAAPQGPGQVANRFETDQDIATATLPLRQSGANTVEGNLLSLPVGGGFLYVQPLYVERAASGSGAFPLLRLVFVSFADRVAVAPTLQEALQRLFTGSNVSTGETPTTPDAPQPSPGPAPPDGGTSGTLAQAIAQAQQAYDRAVAAQRAGDWAAYGTALRQLEAALARADQLSGAAPAPAPPSP